ncbi:protein kinase [Streptomyces sp. NPDC014991]|uniref:serine/threonine-protein kinase n=1 Tax=Streptomyces sp. NPDC014991 TaxID=3364935 RepID=UPI0036FF59AD
MRLSRPALALSRCATEVLGGRYRLDAVIGSGGAGDVHRGYDLRLKRPVAVKVFRTDADIDMEDRLDSEAVILARLHHPGLVAVYDAGRHNGRAYLVMQLIEGPTLKERITAGPLAPAETAALGADLALALSHAHDAGVVHRDVKPSNIILDASGHPHLTDFGISRLLDATTRTATGTLIGTAAYLSPEQVLGQSVGPAADVYALGLVLLECLTSRLEYDGGPLEAAIARLHRPPELPDGLPDELTSLLRDMTALEAQDRPSARDCAGTLAAVAETASPQPVLAPADVTSMVAREAPAAADVTHPHPSHAGGTAARRAVPARGRIAVAGGVAALAAVMAAGFTVSDGSAHRGSGDATTRAAGSPTARTERPGASPAGSAPGSTAPTSPTRDASAVRLRNAALDRSFDPATSLKPAAGANVPGTPAAARHSTAAGTPDTPVTTKAGTATPSRTESRPADVHADKPAKPGKPDKSAKPGKSDKPEKAEKGKEKPGKPGKGKKK